MRIFGFATDAHGAPIIQKPGDLLPGTAYVSTTSMSVPDTPAGTQRHYVDATAIPYVVLSRAFVDKFHVASGDLAVVYRPATKKLAFAVYADGGSLGEASVRLHQDLGSNPIVRRAGIDRAKAGIGDKTLTLVFPGIHSHAVLDAAAWRAEIDTLGKAALAAWGGKARLAECAP